MNLFARLRKAVLFVFLLTVSCCVSAQQYKLSGSYSDGKKVQTNDVFFLNDSCTFFVENQLGDTLKFKSCEWIYAGQFTDLEYKSLNTINNQNTYGFKLDESIEDYSGSQLNRITVRSENSVYFSAKIKLNGVTETDENVSLEFPVYLNVLPNIPCVTFVDLVDIGIFDEQYGDYYSAVMLARFNIDRTDKYKLVVKDKDASSPYVYYVYFADNKTDTQVVLDEYDTEFRFTALNQFGAVINDSVFNFKVEAWEALKNILSVNNELSENNSFKVYPNPVKDNLYITGKTENILQLQIVNSEGHLLNTISNFGNSIDFTSYPKGLYIIKLVTDTHNKQTYKILKE